MINRHQAIHFIRHFFTAKRNGHGIHSPFAFGLCEEIFYNGNDFYDFEALKKIRLELLGDNREVETGEFGAGSKTFRSNRRRIKDIANRGISSSLQCEVFYRLVNYLKCSVSIELGTSLGLTTLYLALANKKGRVISIEGSKALSAIATDLARVNLLSNVQFITSEFDAALPGILDKLEKTDLVYIDGNHTREATLRYFYLALQKVQSGSVIVFDDIYWSKGMTEAWKIIKAHPSVSLSIDTFYFGMVFFRKEIKEKTDLRIYL